MDRYPGITKAAIEMARCAGGINRDRSERVVLNKLERFMASGIDVAFNLPEIDAWLADLSDDDLLTAVDGEETDMETLCAKGPPGTHGFLHQIYANAI